MRHKILWMALSAAVVLAATSSAHEGHHHDAMGTIESIDVSQLTLATAQDEVESFVLTEETSYTRGESGVTREDVSVGERAVVMYQKKDGANVAIEVKLPPKAE